MVPGQWHAPVHPEPVAVCLNLQEMYPVADCCSSLICYWQWLQRRSSRRPMSEVVWCAVVLWCENGIHVRHPAHVFKTSNWHRVLHLCTKCCAYIFIQYKELAWYKIQDGHRLPYLILKIIFMAPRFYLTGVETLKCADTSFRSDQAQTLAPNDAFWALVGPDRSRHSSMAWHAAQKTISLTTTFNTLFRRKLAIANRSCICYMGL